MSSHKDEQLNREIEHKVKVIENKSYNPGPAMSTIDYILMIVIACICVLGLIWGGI